MIEWLIQQATEDPYLAAGLPPEGLLSAPETAVYNSLHTIKRRKDWLLGRWTAKRLVQAAAVNSGKRRLTSLEISILAAGDGAPEVWLDEGGRLKRSDFNLSISHSNHVAFCAISDWEAYLVGADIEAIEPRSNRFVEDYFTTEEQESVRQASAENKACLITAIWSGKEAALKATRHGLRLDTRSVSCRFLPPFQKPQDWTSFAIEWQASQDKRGCPQLAGWWRVWRDFVLSLVVMDNPTHAVPHESHVQRH